MASLTLALLVLPTIFGWWHSSREWVGWDWETPFGFFSVQSESSILGLELEWMRHEHRWAFFRNSDPIDGDRMRFPLAPPQVQLEPDYQVCLFAYWHVVAILLILSSLAFALEKTGSDTPNKTWSNTQVVMETGTVTCPTCFEPFEIPLPGPDEVPSEFDYDCEVCCRPMVIRCDRDEMDNVNVVEVLGLED